MTKILYGSIYVSYRVFQSWKVLKKFFFEKFSYPSDYFMQPFNIGNFVLKKFIN